MTYFNSANSVSMKEEHIEMKKLMGIMILCLTFLTTSIIIMIASLSLNIDQLSQSYVNSISSHIPIVVYVFLGVTLLISCVLIFDESIQKFDKK